MILTDGAHAAVNFEHSWGDGVAVLRYFNEVYKDKREKSNDSHVTMEGVSNLEFSLTPNLKSAIENARKEVEENCSALNTDVLQYKRYGKSTIKNFQMSPDAWMQLAFQVSQLVRMMKQIVSSLLLCSQIAYYRQYKNCVPTYESCSTAAFRHGRTETIRSASQWTKACAEAFEQSHTAGVEEMLSLVKKATSHHSQLVKEAAMGKCTLLRLALG